MIKNKFHSIKILPYLAGIICLLTLLSSCTGAGDGSIKMEGIVLSSPSPSLQIQIAPEGGATSAFVENGVIEGVAAQLTVQELDNGRPTDNVGYFLTDNSGGFSVSFVPKKFPDANLLITVESTLLPFQKVTRGIKVAKGKSRELQIYASSTSISGRILSAGGEPLSDVDILIFRDTKENVNQPRFVPYAFQGSHLKANDAVVPHGTTSDDLGYFSIPVHYPEAQFEIKIGSLQENLYEAKNLSLHIKSNENNELGEIPIVSKNNSPQASGPRSAGGGGGVSLVRNLMPIFETNCVCHRSGGAPLGVNLSSPGTIMQTVVGVGSVNVRGTRIMPFDSRNSFLFEKISTTPRAGGRMPLNQTPLSPDQIELIRQWIDEGAPNN